MSRLSRRSRRVARVLWIGTLGALWAAFGGGLAASGQDAPEAAGGGGIVRGQIFDRDSGEPVTGVQVILIGPLAEGEPTRRQQGVTSGAEGEFEFSAAPPGRYDVSFRKEGYRASTMTNFEVVAGTVNRADFPLPPLAKAGGEILELEAFVVEASTVEEQTLGLDFRLEADEQVNTFSAKDFSKFSAGDVAEALERVVGVTIQDGQFAVIRGLEDRYNSTLYNGTPVPSPDPDRQSVQLDLFPSEVVSNLVVSKTFSPDQPSNSSGGGIDIITHDYPEKITFSVKAGTGVNSNAEDRFLRFDGRTDPVRIFRGLNPGIHDIDYRRTELGFRFVEGNPVGKEDDKSGDWYDDLADVLESDYVISFAGRKEFNDREYRFKLVGAREIDYDSAFGFQQSLEPRPPRFTEGETLPIPGAFPGCLFDPDIPCFATQPGRLVVPGDLSLGELNLSDGRYDYTRSTRSERETGYVGIGFDLDPEGHHSLDGSVFYTKAKEETIEFFENGFIPGLDYQLLLSQQFAGDFINEEPENTFGIPEFDFATVTSPILRRMREALNAPPVRTDGTLAASAFFESISFQRDRDLRIYQINGDHDLDYGIPGLHVSWATNWARTTQEEVGLGMLYFYEPCGFVFGFECPQGVDPITVEGVFPHAGGISRGTRVSDLGPGFFVDGGSLLLSSNLIEETSRFWRFDLDWEFDFTQWSALTLYAGTWHERADREVESAFLSETQRVTTDTDPESSCSGNSLDSFCRTPGNTPLELGRTAFDALIIDGADGVNPGRLGNLQLTENEAKRKIDAYYFKGKLELWERLDLIGGFRFEDIFIESLNDPFVNGFLLGGPATFPTRYLFFDRVDNPLNRFIINSEGNLQMQNEPITEFPSENAIFNDQLLGIEVPMGECRGEGDPPPPGTTCVDFFERETLAPFFNGRIDEDKILPSAAFTLRPFEGLTLRGGYSETIARPSFREMGFYVSVEPGTSDLTVGNPQLQLSEVQSYDLRGEYTWGDRGSLVAFSYFWKDIENPIESIVLRDPAITNDINASFRTFFNNTNIADLEGFELEARTDLGFLSGDFSGGPDWWPDFGGPRWLKYISVGGNYTRISAEVERSAFEINRGIPLFGIPEGFGVPAFTEIGGKRRLFNQPEFIWNMDVTLDNPEWGTQLTVAYFRISDRLQAAGSSQVDVGVLVRSFTLDRYVDGFDELRVTLSQEFRLPGDFGKFILKLTGKNLTDSKRQIIYDPSQTVRPFVEREFKIGRDFDISLTYTREF